jgi:TolB protein
MKQLVRERWARGATALAVVGVLAGAAAVAAPAQPPAPRPVISWMPIVAQDSLIRPGEKHFASLRQITFAGENAEAYWSPDGKSLVMQSTRDSYPCDQIFLHKLMDRRSLVSLISTGTGRTTCSYFLTPTTILFSSTHLGSPECPPPADRSQGYVWAAYPEYDIFVRDLATGKLSQLTNALGYDAEATVSTDGKSIVFTSTRDGDLDIYTMDADGQNVKRLTTELGYDGGPFFSPDGRWICYRAYHPKDKAAAADYQELLSRHLLRPGKLDLWVMRSDGSEKHRVTDLQGASFAPFFTPDGKRLIFASNYEDPRGRNFNLYLVNLDGSGLEQVTTEETFDGFPMFSPDGRYLAFSSNRGAAKLGDTNVFIAEWK